MAQRIIGGCVKQQSFYHSGDSGDIVYSLPTVRALGGGIVYLGPDGYPRMQPRQHLTWSLFENIAPLLKAQSYVEDCLYSPKAGVAQFNLNEFRMEILREVLNTKPGYNLARVHLHHFQQRLDEDKKPWLTVPAPRHEADVIVARTERYHNGRFDWRKVVSVYKDRIAFIGTENEWRLFCMQFGDVPHAGTKNLLEVAQVIAGSKLFVGNQSCPFAIAVGLGHAAVLEDCYTAADCYYDRQNITYGTKNLPVLASAKPASLTPRIKMNIETMVDTWTGYGQTACALIAGMIRKGVDVDVHPYTTLDGGEPFPPDLIKRFVAKPGPPGLLIAAITEVEMRLRAGGIVMTLWESTRADSRTVAALNAKAKALIVPCYWTASCMSASGVDIPIFILPLGIDPAVFSYSAAPRNGTFKFGAAGRVGPEGHGGERKYIHETVEWFLEAFPNEKNVELHVKLFSDCKVTFPSDPRIHVIKKYLPTSDMVRWYRNIDCFLNNSRGEGWGLHLHQAMAIGRPVIGPVAGGSSEFMTRDNSLACDFRLCAPSHSIYKGSGHWIEPDRGHFISLMRGAVQNREQTAAVGRKAAESVARFTWDAMADKMIEILKAI